MNECKPFVGYHDPETCVYQKGDGRVSDHDCYTPNDERCEDGWLISFDKLTGREVIVLCQCACHERDMT